MIVGGDVGATLNANHAAGNERVILGAEGGAIIHSFPNNSTTWSDRHTWQFDTDGKLKFGQSSDTNIYRSAANTLKTDDSFVVGSRLYIATRDTNTTSTTALVMNGAETTYIRFFDICNICISWCRLRLLIPIFLTVLIARFSTK